MVKIGDVFTHYKGGKYKFKGIVHPSSEKPKGIHLMTDFSAMHTELGEKIRILDYTLESVGVTNGEIRLYADKVDEYLVLYQALDFGNQLYARPVEMFFGLAKRGDYLVERFKLEKPEVKVYRKKPVEILAMEWDGKSLSSAIEFCGKENLDITGNYPGKLKIRTLEGVLTADVGDYIIKGIKGEVCPIKPDIFKDSYDEVE